jgi:hypothetical protein
MCPFEILVKPTDPLSEKCILAHKINIVKLKTRHCRMMDRLGNSIIIWIDWETA